MMKTICAFLLLMLIGCSTSPLVVANFSEKEEPSKWKLIRGNQQSVKISKAGDSVNLVLGAPSLNCGRPSCDIVLTKSGAWDFSPFNVMMVEAKGEPADYFFLFQDDDARRKNIVYEAEFDPKAKIGGQYAISRIPLTRFKPRTVEKSEIVDQSKSVSSSKLTEIVTIGVRIVPRNVDAKKNQLYFAMKSFWLEAK